MAGSMSLQDLVDDLKASVHDAAGTFGDADWPRLLGLAAAAMGLKRPRTLLGSIEIQAGVDTYPITIAGFSQYKTSLWGGSPIKPWLPCYPGALPRVRVEGDGLQRQLCFDPAPTVAHIGVYGSAFRFWYFAQHLVGADATETTVAAGDRSLLLLRAQAETMRELTMRNVNKTVRVQDGYSGTPRNSTPAALYAGLLKEWSEAP